MKLMHELLSGYAASFPEKAAVTDPLGEITYGEMEERSSSISRSLAALGVGAGDAVAVYVPYVKEILLGAVSAFRTGAVFVPFDSGYPEERLAYMLDDSGTKAILTLKALWEQKPLNFPAERVIFMDEHTGHDAVLLVQIATGDSFVKAVQAAFATGVGQFESQFHT